MAVFRLTHTSALAVICVLALVTPHSNAQDPPVGPFRRWLYNLVIHIPDISLSADGYDLTIHGLNCTHIDLDAIETTPGADSVSYKVDGFGLSCAGDVDLAKEKTPDKPLLEASVSIKVEDSSTLSAGLRLVRNETTGLATKAEAINVKSDVVIKSKDIKFHSSSPLVDILEKIFAPLIVPAVRNELNSQVTTELTNLINTNLTQLLLGLDNKIIPFLHPQPPPHLPAIPGASNLVTSPIIELMEEVFKELDGHGQFSLDTIIDELTNGTGAFDLQHLGDFNMTLNVEGLANITIGLQELSMAGLDTWSKFDLLQAYDNTTLHTSTFQNELAINVTIFVEVNTTDSISPVGLYETVSLVFSMTNASLDVYTFLAINDADVASLTAKDIFSLGCLLDCVMQTNITTIRFGMIIDELYLASKAGGVESDIDEAVDDLINLLLHEYQAVVPAAVNALFAEPIRLELNTALDKLISNATCQPAASSSGRSLLGTYLGVSIGAVLVIVIGILVRRNLVKRGRLLSETSFLLNDSDSQPAPCLAMEENVSPFARYVFPLFIFATAAVFISSNTSIAATVNPVLVIASQEFKFDSLFGFSLANTIRDMWTAEVYALSLLVAVFSGTWPYLKLLLLLACWVLPTSWLSVRRREGILQFLDGYGKWSLLDAFVLIMMMVAFRFSLEIEDPDGKPVGIEIYVEAQTGFHTFIAATVTSLLLSHVMLHIHRSAEKLHHDINKDTQLESLSKREMIVNDVSYSFTPFGNSLLILGIMAMIGLICAGAMLDAFQFKFEGLAAWGLEETGQNVTRTFSLLSMAYELPQSSDSPNTFGTRYLQAAMYLFAFVIPIFHLTLLCIVWIVPMSARVLEKFFVLTEVVYAWSALEVFVISLIAAILEIEQFAQFIIGDRCTEINKILAKYFDKPLHHVDKCFDVIATLSKGSWTLFAACIASMLYALFIMKICHHAVRHRLMHHGSGKEYAMHSLNSVAAHRTTTCCSPVKQFFCRIGVMLGILREAYMA